MLPKNRLALILIALSSATAGTAWALAAFGIEGRGVVSTADSEIRGSVRPDGQRIVWGSPDRKNGPGGWDLWQADMKDGRWQDARPVSLNTSSKDFDPMFSADGKWIYFFSDRPGGYGGDDLYRAEVHADGSFGAARNLGATVNGPGNEWAPTPSFDGATLMFSSDRAGGAGKQDLYVARWDGRSFIKPTPLPGVNTASDEFDAAWLDHGRALVYAQSIDGNEAPIQLFLAECDGKAYVTRGPLPLSFNTNTDFTLSPVLDWSKPKEMLVSGAAPELRMGGRDLYRLAVPNTQGKDGCI